MKELLLLLYLLFCFFITACVAPETDRATDLTNDIHGTIEKNEPFENKAKNERFIKHVLADYKHDISYQKLTINYPFNQSIFPPEIASPTFDWEQTIDSIERWLLIVSFDGRSKPLYIPCNKSSWTPNRKTWGLMKKNSLEGSAQVTILGVAGTSSYEIVSRGMVSISTSSDVVGAPIMFRRVFPSFAYASKNPEQMEWCLADISSYEKPPVIMSRQPVCGSCHTFSKDGDWLGMDMDYKNDKGAYFVTAVGEEINLDGRDFISWNDFPRADGLQGSGLFSRISPDSKNIVSTINEINFLIKIPDPYCSQLFYPIQGSLAIYSMGKKKIYEIGTGGDDRNDVRTDPSWSPDGKSIIFSRTVMKRDLFKELGGKTIFPAENGATIEQLNGKYPVQFDVYRIPFNKGKGGKAEPVSGASHNGKSNYCARYSPDGKWIVFTQSKTGLVLQPDSKLYIIPVSGGEPRKMRANLSRVNSWHTWSPNSRWLAFVSKENSPFTELFLTHIDEQGNDSPPILLKRFNKIGYAINVPEFANISPQGIRKIELEGS